MIFILTPGPVAVRLSPCSASRQPVTGCRLHGEKFFHSSNPGLLNVLQIRLFVNLIVSSIIYLNNQIYEKGIQAS
jgi:hypothetical protein